MPNRTSKPVKFVEAAPDPDGHAESVTRTSMTKLGYVHVPKCGGSALSRALYGMFETPNLHVSKLVDAGDSRNDYYALERGTLSWWLAKSVPLLSGHIKYADMMKLDRKHVFTVLRDPGQRLFSLYTYNISRSLNARTVARKPELTQIRKRSFAEHVRHLKPNLMARQLVGDYMSRFGSFDELAQKGPAILSDPITLRRLDVALKRYFAVYFCPLQDAADDIAARFGLGGAKVERLNESRADIEFVIGTSEQEFLALTTDRIWLDRLVIQRARKMFPLFVTHPLEEPEALLTGLKKRYKLHFLTEI